MSGKEIYFNKNYTDKLCEGISELAKAVTSTLGPSGSTVLLAGKGISEVITKDGVSVARAISFDDHIKNAGANLIKECAEKANAEAGDGTTTTTLLASSLILEGINLINNGFNAGEISRTYKKCAEQVLSAIKKQTVQFNAEDNMIYKIATISANNDEEVGGIVAEAYSLIGDNGVVNILDNQTKNNRTVIKQTKGLQINKAIRASAFTTDVEKTQFESQDPIIAILAERIAYKDIFPLVQKASSLKRDVVIFATDFDEMLTQQMMKICSEGQCKAALIQAQGFDLADQISFCKDLAAMTSSTMCYNAEELKAYIDTINDGSHYIDSIVSVLRDKTNISGFHGTEEAIEKRIAEIQDKISKAYDEQETSYGLSDTELEGLREEIAMLSGGVVTILVGSNSTSATIELKDRYEDAVHAVSAAISDGVVPGGGTTLLRAAKALDDKTFLKSLGKITPSIQAALDIYKKVLKMPFKKIVASDDVDYMMGKILHSKKPYSGYNAKTYKWCDDMIKEGVIDSARTTSAAIKYSTEQAAVVISAKCVVSPPNHIRLEPNDMGVQRAKQVGLD